MGGLKLSGKGSFFGSSRSESESESFEKPHVFHAPLKAVSPLASPLDKSLSTATRDSSVSISFSSWDTCSGNILCSGSEGAIVSLTILPATARFNGWENIDNQMDVIVSWPSGVEPEESKERAGAASIPSLCSSSNLIFTPGIRWSDALHCSVSSVGSSSEGCTLHFFFLFRRRFRLFFLFDGTVEGVVARDSEPSVSLDVDRDGWQLHK